MSLITWVLLLHGRKREPSLSHTPTLSSVRMPTHVGTHKVNIQINVKKGIFLCVRVKDLLSTNCGIYITSFYHFLVGQSKPPDSRVGKWTPGLNSYWG